MPTETRAKAASKSKDLLERDEENFGGRDNGRNVSSADQDISLEEKIFEACRGQEASRRENSHFQREILNTVGEQRVLMIEYKETHDRQLFELTNELKRLSLEFTQLYKRNNELEQTVID